MCIVVNYRIGYFYWEESGKYLVNYLEEKPILTKLYDYHQHDAEVYRPRELGNVFNMIDSYLVLSFAAVGLTNFLSPLHFLCMFVIVSVPLAIAYKEKTHRVLAVLLGLLFLTTPQPFMTTYYFRTSKSVVSMFIALYIWLLYSKKNNWIQTTAMFFLTVAMGTTDEMGILMAVAFCLYFSCQIFFSSQKLKYVRYVISSGVGLGGVFFYRNIISPRVTTFVLGEVPVIWGQNSLHLSSIPTAIELLFSYLGFLTGGIRGIFLLPLVTSVGLVLTYEIYKKKFFFLVFSGLTGLAVSFFTLAVALMLSAHEIIAGEELRLIYYPLPFVTLWFFLLFLAVYALLRRYPRLFFPITGSLLILLCVNISRIPFYQQKYLTWWKVEKFVGDAFPLIEYINKETLTKKEIPPIDGTEAIYILRKRLGRAVTD